MPYSVEGLIENQSLLTIQENELVAVAIELMLEHDFSQLPVVDGEGKLIGLITYQSIMQAARSFNVKLNELHVRDGWVKVRPFDIDSSLFDLLDEIQDKNAVVIVDPNEKPIGIVTSYDTAEFLRSQTEDLMRVENIESAIKSLIPNAYADSKNGFDEKKLDAAVERLNTAKGDRGPDQLHNGFEELTLSDYIQLLTMKSTWVFFEPILQIKREALIELLNKIRTVRNDLAHFRPNIDARRRAELRYCADWISRRFEEYQKSKKVSLPGTLLAVHEPKQEYQTAVDKPSGRRSVYAALADWLAQQTESEKTLSFEQIEGITNRPLPPSALELRAWWANDRVGHTHSILWLEAGWRVESVSLSDRWVRFSRM